MFDIAPSGLWQSCTPSFSKASLFASPFASRCLALRATRHRNPSVAPTPKEHSPPCAKPEGLAPHSEGRSPGKSCPNQGKPHRGGNAMFDIAPMGLPQSRVPSLSRASPFASCFWPFGPRGTATPVGCNQFQRTTIHRLTQSPKGWHPAAKGEALVGHAAKHRKPHRGGNAMFDIAPMGLPQSRIPSLSRASPFASCLWPFGPRGTATPVGCSQPKGTFTALPKARRAGTP